MNVLGPSSQPMLLYRPSVPPGCEGHIHRLISWVRREGNGGLVSFGHATMRHTSPRRGRTGGRRPCPRPPTGAAGASWGCVLRPEATDARVRAVRLKKDAAPARPRPVGRAGHASAGVGAPSSHRPRHGHAAPRPLRGSDWVPRRRVLTRNTYLPSGNHAGRPSPARPPSTILLLVDRELRESCVLSPEITHVERWRRFVPFRSLRYSTRLPAGRPSVLRTTTIPLARNDLSQAVKSVFAGGRGTCQQL